MTDTRTIFAILKDYAGDTWFLYFFLAAVLYLLWREEKKTRKNLLIVLIGAVLLIFNNVSMKLVSYVVGDETYYRFLWMVPMVPIMGYVLVDLLIRQKKKIGKVLVIAAAALLVVLGGESCLKTNELEMVRTVHYVDPEIQVMGHLIEQDKDRMRPLVAAPASISIPIRLYNSNIRNYIKRTTYLKEGKLTSKKLKKVRQKRAYQVVHGEKITKEQLRNLVKKGKIDYFIIGNEHEMDEYMLEAGFEILANTGNYTIYRC